MAAVVDFTGLSAFGSLGLNEKSGKRQETTGSSYSRSRLKRYHRTAMNSDGGSDPTTGDLTASSTGSTICERVISVIAKAPVERTESDILPLLPWLRQRVKTFSGLSQEVVSVILKECAFTTAYFDDVIIKQGDQGDRCYVLLRGSVAVYINNVISDEEDTSKIAELASRTSSLLNDNGTLDRSKFGSCVDVMEVGTSFGEFALLSENCIRQASIIANERCDLLVVNRDLYNRSLHSSQAADFAARMRFVETNPLFRRWPQAHRRQMAMSIRHKKVLFDQTIVRQGDEVDALYFVYRGQAKIVLDPLMHSTQYAQLMQQQQLLPPPLTAVDENDAVHSDATYRWGSQRHHGGISDRTMSLLENWDATNEHGMTNAWSALNRPRLKPIRRNSTGRGRRQLIEICIVGANDFIGDVEFALGLRTYMQSFVCDEQCDVFYLNTRNYERLVIKKHPTTAHIIQAIVQCKLSSRAARLHYRTVPLFSLLLTKIDAINRSNAEATNGVDRHPNETINTSSTSLLSYRKRDASPRRSTVAAGSSRRSQIQPLSVDNAASSVSFAAAINSNSSGGQSQSLQPAKLQRPSGQVFGRPAAATSAATATGVIPRRQYQKLPPATAPVSAALGNSTAGFMPLCWALDGQATESGEATTATTTQDDVNRNRSTLLGTLLRSKTEPINSEQTLTSSLQQSNDHADVSMTNESGLPADGEEQVAVDNVFVRTSLPEVEWTESKRSEGLWMGDGYTTSPSCSVGRRPNRLGNAYYESSDEKLAQLENRIGLWHQAVTLSPACRLRHATQSSQSVRNRPIVIQLKRISLQQGKEPLLGNKVLIRPKRLQLVSIDRRDKVLQNASKTKEETCALAASTIIQMLADGKSFAACKDLIDEVCF